MSQYVCRMSRPALIEYVKNLKGMIRALQSENKANTPNSTCEWTPTGKGHVAECGDSHRGEVDDSMVWCMFCGGLIEWKDRESEGRQNVQGDGSPDEKPQPTR